MPVFFSDIDRQEYLHCLKEESRKHDLTILSYCLMSNHVHLVVMPAQKESLARAIGEAHRRYTTRINERQGSKGYLFQGRFYSCPMDEQHAIAAIRYVEQNPVRAGMAHYPWDYIWSSASFRVGKRERDPLVNDPWPIDGSFDWRELLEREPSQTDILRKNTRTGRPCGNESFVSKLEAISGRTLRKDKPGPKVSQPTDGERLLW